MGGTYRTCCCRASRSQAQFGKTLKPLTYQSARRQRATEREGEMRNLVLTAITLMVGACASTPNNYRPVTRQISFPTIGEETSVSIGDPMMNQGTATEVRGIVLSEENNIRNFVFTPGFYPQVGEDAHYTYHSFQIGMGMNGIGALRPGGGILAPDMSMAVSLRASKGQQELCVDLRLGTKPCDTEHGYQRTTRPMVGENNFQQTLIYNGRVGDRIRIGYREFSGDVARPAFSNEVEYDLSTSHEITYRGARIRIIEANNQQIRYVVLSNFNTSR
jgi:hypothetical protein